MKLRKLVSMAVVVFLLTLAITSIASADVTVNNARIVLLGYKYPGVVVLNLQDMGTTPAFPGIQSFFINTNISNESYALLLTAHSLGQNIRFSCLGVNAPIPNGATIHKVYLLSN